MQATALSRTVRIIGRIHVTERYLAGIDNMAFLNKDMRRCPAIMLAVSRTHSVIGRIRFLVSSIRTMKFIREVGVPCGRRWESM